MENVMQHYLYMTHFYSYLDHSRNDLYNLIFFHQHIHVFLQNYIGFVCSG